MTPERLGLLWGVTVFAGAGARLLAAVSKLPGVVLLLLSGLLIGRSGLGLVEPLDLGSGLGTVVGLLVSLVLFDGGEVTERWGRLLDPQCPLPADTTRITGIRPADLVGAPTFAEIADEFLGRLALKIVVALEGGVEAGHVGVVVTVMVDSLRQPP